jgi:hypothetical protein
MFERRAPTSSPTVPPSAAEGADQTLTSAAPIAYDIPVGHTSSPAPRASTPPNSPVSQSSSHPDRASLQEERAWHAGGVAYRQRDPDTLAWFISPPAVPPPARRPDATPSTLRPSLTTLRVRRTSAPTSADAALACAPHTRPSQIPAQTTTTHRSPDAASIPTPGKALASPDPFLIPRRACAHLIAFLRRHAFSASITNLPAPNIPNTNPDRPPASGPEDIRRPRVRSEFSDTSAPSPISQIEPNPKIPPAPEFPHAPNLTNAHPDPDPHTLPTHSERHSERHSETHPAHQSHLADI